MSKVDPEKFNKLDRRSTLLLKAARSQIGTVDEKSGMALGDPGIDALRGSFGTVGSIIRARTLSRMSQNSQNTTHVRMRPPGAAAPCDPYADLTRHQLYDPPVRQDDTSSIQDSVISQPFSNKRPTIKFDSQDVVHSYQRPGTGDNTATHEHRQAQGPSHNAYPPLSDKENVFVTSPTMTRNATTPQIIPRIPLPHSGQLVNVPPSIANEHTVQSAPAEIQGRYSPPDSAFITKDPFDSTSGKETLLSFPSVTDSAPSEWGPVDVEKDVEKDRVTGNVKENVKKGKSRERTKSPKRYPRGSVVDDEEESRTLFGKDTISEEGDDNGSVTPPLPGIRLVSPGYF
jgi:magnesium transporter